MRTPRCRSPGARRSRNPISWEAVVKVLQDLLEKRLDYASRDGESFVDATQNARLVAAAQHYYRSLYHGAELSWNLRDRHMFETLVAMMRARDAKAVVWAHNSHVGNAAATEMGSVREEFNIGQLCREEFGATRRWSASGRTAARSRPPRTGMRRWR